MEQQNDDGSAATNAADKVRDETTAAAETVASGTEDAAGKVEDVVRDTTESLNPSRW